MTKNISIIIPAYNAQKTLDRCLRSLLDLDYDATKLEIIVVDNNSTDETAKIVHSYPRVTYLLEKKQGRSYARNSGAQLARGELLAFIDSDVFVDRDWLSELAKGFEHAFVGGGQGRIIPSDYDGQRTLNNFRIRQQHEATNGSNIILHLMYGESPMVNSAACIYQSEAFHFVGGFDVLLERHEDIDLAKRVFVAGYDLFAASKAIAFVEYHGEGWWSYFKRSFEEGATKQSYNEKWTKYFSFMNRDEKERKEWRMGNYLRIPDSLRLNYQLVKYEIVFNFLRTIRRRDFHYFLKALNTTFRALGRIWGKLKYGYKHEFVPKFHPAAVQQVIVMGDGSIIHLDSTMRFVSQDGELLYAMNIKNNQFLNFSESSWLGKIIKHRCRVTS